MNADGYNITGCSLMHQSFVKEIFQKVLSVKIEEGKGYERTLCGGLAEASTSTIEIADVDVNARFFVEEDMIEVKPSDKFLYHVIVPEDRKNDMDKLVYLMQQHPVRNLKDTDFEVKGKGIEKSYLKKDGVLYLSSHVARWQLIGVLKTMKKMKVNVDDSSRIASEVGLENGVYNVMIYDSMVCRRGIWRKESFKHCLEENFKDFWKSKLDSYSNMVLESFLSQFLCLYPPAGIQIDYTAGFIIHGKTIPKKAKEWVGRMKKDWPSQHLKKQVLKKGAHLVPKVFLNTSNQRESRARQWRLNFDLNLVIFDPSYSKHIDVRRV